jgi:hypothetical protein
LRTPILCLYLCAAAAAPALAQQPGPVAPVPADESDAATTPRKRVFPLWKSLLGGREFMRPFGLNLVFFDLSGQWDVESFSASVAGDELASLSGTANVHPFTYGGRADLWIFPFLNVFATAGGVRLEVEAVGEDLPLAITGLPPEPVRGDLFIPLDFTGYYGGGGIVASALYKNVFASADASVVWTHLKSQQSGVTGDELATHTASFRIGYNAGPIQPYVGGRYVRKIDRFEGTIAGPGGQPVTFAVELQAPKWNAQAGVHGIIKRRFEVLVEAGFGKRSHGLVNFGYRL